MSNFLTHLIARASQQAPVLARRQPALFEPVVSALSLTESIGGSDAPSLAASPVRPSIARATHEEAGPLRMATAAPATTDQSEPPPLQANAPMQPSFPATPRPGAARPATGDEATTDVVRVTEAAKPASAAALAAPARIPPQAEPPKDRQAVGVDSFVTVQRSPVLIAEALPPRPGVSDKRDAAVQNSAIKNDRHQDAPTSVLLPARPQNAQALQLAKAVQSHAVTAAAAAVTAAKESVQITIGRVEVRAVAAAERPPMRAGKSTAPRLTLDDYLRQRNGGRQ